MGIRKILVVDDSPAMIRILVNTLNKAGYSQVETAESGRDALEKLAADPNLGLVLTDWNMPEMNGLELLGAIKADPKMKNIPVIMVTSRSVKEDILLAIRHGAKDYIVKPFSVEAIKQKLQNIL
jgi:two-component system, chemotaxis family, chemotaxis protein CheY